MVDFPFVLFSACKTCFSKRRKTEALLWVKGTTAALGPQLLNIIKPLYVYSLNWVCSLKSNCLLVQPQLQYYILGGTHLIPQVFTPQKSLINNANDLSCNFTGKKREVSHFRLRLFPFLAEINNARMIATLLGEVASQSSLVSSEMHFFSSWVVEQYYTTPLTCSKC